MTTARNPRICCYQLLTLITCLSVLPAHAKYSGGRGVPNDPYQIATAEDLMLLGDSPDDYGKHFILTSDIDLDPNLPGRRVFDKALIAAPASVDTYGRFVGTPFTGVFDGNGRTISNFSCASIGRDCVGRTLEGPLCGDLHRLSPRIKAAEYWG